MKPSIRKAKILYLIFIALSCCGIVFTSLIFVPGDIESSVSNIRENEFLFRLEFIISIAIIVVFFYLIITLYRLFRTHDPRNANLMIIFVIAQISLSLLINIFGIVILSILKMNLLSIFEAVNVKEFVASYFEIWNFSNYTEEIYFGLWLIPAAILLYRSKNVPKLNVILLILGFIAWAVNCYLFFKYPGEISILWWIAMITAIAAEVSFTLWLIKSVEGDEGHIDEVL